MSSRPAAGGRRAGSASLADSSSPPLSALPTAGRSPSPSFSPDEFEDTDRAAYVTFLERQVERVSAATLNVESFASQLRSLQSALTAASERVEQLARLVQLDQQYSDSVREEITRALHSLQLQTQETITPALNRLEAAESRLQRLEAAAREDGTRRAADEQAGRRRQQQDEREQAMAAAVEQLRKEAKEREDGRKDADRQLQQTLERSRHEQSSHHAAVEERITTLQSKAEEESRQRREADGELLSRLRQLEERMTSEQQSAASRSQKEEALQQEVRETLRVLGDRQRVELLRNVEDLRRFQLEVRDEARRRERKVETMRKALSNVCDELDDRSAAGGGVSGSSSRWREMREEEQREREEKDRRRLRHAARSIRRELLQHVDQRIALLMRPARSSPSPYVHVGEGGRRAAEEKEAEVEEEPDSGLQRLEQLIGLIRKPDADAKTAANAKQSRSRPTSSRASVSLRPAATAASRQSAASARLSRTKR